MSWKYGWRMSFLIFVIFTLKHTTKTLWEKFKEFESCNRIQMKVTSRKISRMFKRSKKFYLKRNDKRKGNNNGIFVCAHTSLFGSQGGNTILIKCNQTKWTLIKSNIWSYSPLLHPFLSSTHLRLQPFCCHQCCWYCNFCCVVVQIKCFSLNQITRWKNFITQIFWIVNSFHRYFKG